MIRDYRNSDLEAVRKIHEESGIDYRFPDIGSPLFIIKTVEERDGKVVAFYGMMMQVESYAILSKEPWATPREKLRVVEELNKESLHEAWLQGIDSVVCYVPPGMDRFYKWIQKRLEFKEPRAGWRALSRGTKQ